MHGSIRDRLEDLLSLEVAQNEPVAHLSGCPECSSELAVMRAQAGLLKSLRSPEEVEPVNGFYARVMQRIEERAKVSMWASLLYSPFGKRLVYASLTAVIALGTYVVTKETRDGHLQDSNVIAQDFHEDALVEGSPSEQRDAVLVNFVFHQPPVEEGTAQ